MNIKTKKNIRKALILTTLLLTGCSSKKSEYIIKEEVGIEQESNKPEIEEIKVESVEVVPEVKEEIVEKIEEEVKENEHVDLLMIGDMLIHTPVYKSGIQEDGSLNYDHFFENILDDLEEAEIKVVNQGLTADLIMDGNIMYNNLKAFGKNEEWLLNKIKENGYHDIKDIFLLVCNGDGKIKIYENNYNVGTSVLE